MKDFICAMIMILITVFLMSCTTPITARVPEIASDDAMLEKLIENPKTEEDMLYNSIVLEHLYVNQKLQTYSLLEYIATLAEDKDAKTLYTNKIENIKKVYDL